MLPRNPAYQAGYSPPAGLAPGQGEGLAGPVMARGSAELRPVELRAETGEAALLARLLERFDRVAGHRGAGLQLRDLGAQYVADLEARGARPCSIRQARAALVRILATVGATQVDELTKPLAITWRSARVDAGASHRTANVDVGALSAALNLAVQLGQLGVNPLAGLRSLDTSGRHSRRKSRALSKDDIDRLLAAAWEVDGRSRAGFPRAPLVQSLIATCARWSELVFTTWADLDVEAAILTLRSETTKNGRGRAIPLAPDTLRSILDLRSAHTRVRGMMPTAGARIFLTARGCDWTSDTSNFRRYLHEVMRVAKLPYADVLGRVLHTHALRKTGATRYARAGADLLELQKLLGHSDPKLTATIYTELEDERLRRAVLAAPRLVLDR